MTGPALAGVRPANLDMAPSPPVALYIHVPFCVSLCPYCDFVVLAGSATRGPRNRVAAFVAAVRAEVNLRADALDGRFGSLRSALRSVYLGGGTPSLLPADEIGDLLALIDRRFRISTDAEITLEANPGPDERGDPAAQRRAGVTRLSYGAQSLDAAELRRLGRRHRPEDVADAVAAARAAGIPSISLDLLYDIPDQSTAPWASTLDGALALAPDHLSLYALTLDDPDREGLTGLSGDHLPTTLGARRWRDRARPAQDDDRAAEQYVNATEVLRRAGWRGYEISNWARPGHESRHNLAYWERLPYEAVGPGAHAFDGASRRWNAARLDGYVGALTPIDVAAPRLPPGGNEGVDAGTAAAERLILGLRLDRGVLAADLEARDGDMLAWAIGESLIAVDGDDRARLTTRGRLLSNEIFARLV